MLGALAAIALLSAAAPSPCGLPPLREGALPFAAGEVLAYDVDLFGIVKAGTVRLAVEPPISRGTLLPLRAHLRTTSLVAKLRPLRGFAISWVDATTLRPQRYRDETEDRERLKSTDTRLDQPGPLTMAFTEERRGEKGDRSQWTSTFTPEREVMDLVSMLYYLRAARLSPGEEICFDLVANRRFWRLRGKVAPAGERLETGGGTFDTIRLDAVLTRDDGLARPIRFWYGKDARRTPVKAVSETDFGPGRAILSHADEPQGEPTK